MKRIETKSMKALAILLLALTVSLASAKPPGDEPSKFPNVGETYKISIAAPLAEIPYENVVTVTALGDHQWAKVKYQISTREGKQTREMWINFAQVASAVNVPASAK